MQSSLALSLMALSFALFGAALLIVPVWLASTKVRRWREVAGLWMAGWGFLLIGAGTYLAYRGFGSLVGFGVLVTVVGHLIQRRATRGKPQSRGAS